MSLAEELKEKFVKFYIAKNSNDIDKTIQEIMSLGIKLFYAYQGLCITVKRPGILIGRKGENIDNLKKYLGCEVVIKEFAGCDIEDQLINLVHQNDPNFWHDVFDYTS